MRPIIELNQKTYLIIIITLIPALNFLSGINIDLYSPSLPALAIHFHQPMVIIKMTISLSMIGFAIGCLFIGPMMDVLNRQRLVLIALSTYTITSFLAIACNTIELILIIRFIQGLSVSVTAIGSRSLAFEQFENKKLTIALLYTSIAYSIGPIIGPFIGGTLQYHFGWQANFIAYGVIGGILWLLLIICLRKKPLYKTSNLQVVLVDIKRGYLSLLHSKFFMFTVIQLACMQTIILIYPTIGAYIIEKKLHLTALDYGYTALIIGCGYLIGSLINRKLIHTVSAVLLIKFGQTLMLVAFSLQILFGIIAQLNLITLIVPVFIVCMSCGFMFSNILIRCLKQFPEYSGIASSLQMSTLMALASGGIYIISQFEIDSLHTISLTYGVVIFSQFIFFNLWAKHIKKIDS